MGFRFRKTIRLLPLARLNISKSGTSLSLGKRGLTVNLGKKGTRTTLGAPGTGLSYSHYTPHEKSPNGDEHPPTHNNTRFSRYWHLLALAVIVMMALYSLL